MLKLLQPLQKCTYTYFHSFFRHLPYNLCPSASPAPGGRPKPTTIFGTIAGKQTKSSSDSDKDSVGTSTILVQDGLNFQELPVVVRKTNRIMMPDEMQGEAASTEENDLDTIAKFQSLAKCQTLDEVVDLLDTLPPSEVTSGLAAFSLFCFSEHQHSNEDDEFEHDTNANGDAIETNDSLANDMSNNPFREAIVNKLFDIICQNGKTTHLLRGLHAVVYNEVNVSQESEIFEKLCNSFLLRLSEGAASIADIFEFAMLLQTVRGNHRMIMDKLWSGISEKSNEIGINNLLLMYKMLPWYQHSRAMIFKLLEKKTYQLWWQLRIQDITGILSILIKIDKPHSRLMTSLTKWVNLNIHLVDEKDLTTVVSSLDALGHIDSNIVTAIERLVRVKNKNVQEPLLVKGIMSYCFKFRLRSPVILDNVATYFIAHATDLSPLCVLSIVKPFGLLNYLPLEPYEFYSKLEEVLQAKFIQFRPEDVVELLLSCTYIQRFPQNFVKKIFSQHFLDRISTIENKLQLQQAHENLKLLDTAMTLECRYYRGPMLIVQHANAKVWRDGRLSHQTERLSDILAQTLGGRENFATGRHLKKLPVSEQYTIDFIVHFNVDGKPIPFNERLRIGKRIAVLIHLPEHYCFNSKELIGQQATKIRHLQKLGYSVVQLDYEEVASINCEKELKDLLNRKLYINFK